MLDYKKHYSIMIVYLILMMVILLYPSVISISETVENNSLIKHDIYKSVKGRPIDVYVFGAGNSTILVIGGIHGDESSGVTLARLLLEYLKSQDISKFHCRIVLIPVANPDGYKARTRVNAHKIDINRNFPTRDFGKGPLAKGCYSGKKPASEPETLAILNVVKEYEPSLIITFHAAMGCVNYDGPALEIAESISQKNGLPVKSDLGYPTPGSLGTYYGRERNIPVITLELLPGRLNQWEQQKEALLDVLEIVKFNNEVVYD